MNWTGHITRTGGALSSGDDVINLTVTPGESSAILRGEAPNRHWHGEISADRKTWFLECQFGFRFGGTASAERGGYRLVSTWHETPAEFLLPGETARKGAAA